MITDENTFVVGKVKSLFGGMYLFIFMKIRRRTIINFMTQRVHEFW